MKLLKFVSVLTAAVAVLGMGEALSVSCHADEMLDGDYSYEEGAPFVPYDCAPDEKNSRTIIRRVYDPGYYGTLAVTPFQQENGHYCGPATTRQVIDYLNGSSASQDTYARLLGTTSQGTEMPKIRDVLNQKTSKTYRYNQIGSESTWMNRIETDIKKEKPVVLDIKASNTSEWPYTTKGHYINTSGIDSKTGHDVRIRITDPYWKAFGNRWCTADELYNVNSNHFRQAMIW